MRVSRPQGDTGAADPGVAAALEAYARGTGSEHDALTAIARARLLVPVVALLTEESEAGTEKESEMALPTLVGNDGRTAVIAFTGTDTLRRWRQDARPVPVPATRVCEAALSEAAAAVVIDVAGPVPLAVEGARLRALAANQPPPPPHEDPDIAAEVAAVTPHFTLEHGGPDSDLLVHLTTADAAEARRLGGEIALRLRPRLRRGIEVTTAPLSRTNRGSPSGTPPPSGAPPSGTTSPPAEPPPPQGAGVTCVALAAEHPGSPFEVKGPFTPQDEGTGPFTSTPSGKILVAPYR